MSEESRSARAIIRISAIPDSNIGRVLSGTVDATSRANRRIVDSAERTAREQQRINARFALQRERLEAQAALQKERLSSKAAAAVERALRRQTQTAEREAKKAADAAIREEERTERFKQRVAEAGARLQIRMNTVVAREQQKSYRTQIQAAQRAAKEEQKLARETAELRKRLLRGLGGAVVGAGAVALSRVDAAAGALGARSPEEMLTGAIDIRRRTARLSDQAGVPAKQLEQQTLGVSVKTGVPVEDLLGGLEKAQAQFSEFGGAGSFGKSLEDIAKISVATGTDIDSVVTSMGVLRRQFGLTEAEMNDLGKAMVDAGDKGNIEFRDLASTFVTGLGALGRAGGLKGKAGAQTALGIAQVMGASDMSPAEASTRVTNLVTALNKGEVRKGFKKQFGVSLADKQGNLRDLPTVVEELSSAGFSKSSSGTKRQRAVGDVQAREAFEILVKQFEAGPELFRTLMHPSAEVGGAAVERRFGAMQAGELGRASTLGARQFAQFYGSPQFEPLLKAAVNSADALTMLTSQYPLFAEALKIATGALGGFTAALLASGGGKGAGGLLPRLLGGGAAGGAAGAAPAVTTAAGGGLFSGLTATGLAAGGAAVGATALGALALAPDSIVKPMMSGLGLERPLQRAGHGIADLKMAQLLVPSSARSGPVLLHPDSVRALGAEIRRHPDAKVTIKVDGPGRVTSTRATDLDVDVADAGNFFTPLP